MPILAVSAGGVIVEPPIDPGTGGTVDPGTGGTDGGVITPVIVNPGGATSYSLRTADGQTWDLGDYSNTFVTIGRRGFDSPTYTAYSTESPGFDGEVFSGARATARDLLVPIFLRADTRDEFLIRKRNLLAGLSPKRGVATIEIAESDGTRRRLNCYYTGRGGEGETTRDRAGRTWARYTLEFRAPDPYWRGDPTVYEFRSANTANFYPLLPLRVSSGVSLGLSDIVVPGEVESYPVWTVHGPTSGGIVLRFTPEGGTARSILLSSVLTAGQWVQINTHPTQLTVLDHTGANRWGDVLAGSGMWPIQPGPIRVEVTAAGATAATRVELSVEPRYETA